MFQPKDKSPAAQLRATISLFQKRKKKETLEKPKWNTDPKIPRDCYGIKNFTEKPSSIKSTI